MIGQSTIEALIEAENKANFLFEEAVNRNIFRAQQSEKQINEALYELAYELFEIKKYWHKRIVRAGINTLHPYKENPLDLIVQEDDILFVDFGPVFDKWEADVGKTFVIGNNPIKLKLKNDVSEAWQKTQQFYKQNLEITGAELYQYVCNLAKDFGWEFGNVHCGHLIGEFPHERIEGESKINYLHPENNLSMNKKGIKGNELFWILEIHFVDKDKQFGAFQESILYK
jgi:Xaa-Pro aminopeptidase